ncbi:MAG: DUF4143 domain-containing protein [Mucispirillum sp.]|nr:DUF4143 domain-containing protein [Mucispirillum sp.]
MRFIRRSIVEYIKTLCNINKPVIITGMRGVGKLSAIRSYYENIPCVQLSNIKEILFASNSCSDFFTVHKAPVIINDAQYALNLFKHISNADNKKIFLIANQQLDCINEYKEYMQDKCIYLELMGLSIYEMANMGYMQKPYVPSKRPPCIISKKSIHHTFKLIWRGFFPDYEETDNFDEWDNFYSRKIEEILQKDINDKINIINKTAFLNFLTAAAAYTGKELNIAEIAEKVNAAPNTVKNWVYILEKAGIIYLLKPYYAENNKRYIKTPKIYMTDTGLAAWLLSINSADELEKSKLSSSFFETFVIMELLKSYRHNGRKALFYYYRDNSKVTIDLLIEDEECFYPLNIKNTTEPKNEYVSSFKKAVIHKKLGYGSLICLTDMYKALNNDVTALSIWEI